MTPGAATGTRPPVRPDPETRRYFEAAAAGRLALPHCAACRRFHWFPARRCPSCGSLDIEWPAVDPVGELFSFTVVDHPVMEWWSDRVPYVIGLVDLPAAPDVRLLADLVNVDPADVEIGLAVRATFEPVGEGLGLVHFEPVPQGRER